MHAPPADRTRAQVGPFARAQRAGAGSARTRSLRGRSKLLHLAMPPEIHDRVVGPVNGYFIALAAWESPQHPGEYVAYYKLSAGQPSNYWDVVGHYKGSVPDVMPDSATALAAAADLGGMHARNLPAPQPWNFAA